MTSVRHRATRALLVGLVIIAATSVAPTHAAAATTCPGDCNADGMVTINELIVGVNIALETAPVSACPAFDVNGDEVVTVNELILGVNASLEDCPSPPGTATPTPAPTNVATATPTATPVPGELPISAVIARTAAGVAVHLGETVTTDGVLTVSAGIFANNKLKVFAQDGVAGVMVFHQTSSEVPAFQAGDRLQVHGVVVQEDPTSDNNRAKGTVTVDVSHGSWKLLSSDNPQPATQDVTLASLQTDGTRYTGTVVRVQNVRKVAGDWPQLGDRSTLVTISDDGGATQVILRFQRNTITVAMSAKLDAIGDGPFTLTGIVVQDDPATDGTLLHGFEIWVRGAEDVQAPPT